MLARACSSELSPHSSGVTTLEPWDALLPGQPWEELHLQSENKQRDVCRGQQGLLLCSLTGLTRCSVWIRKRRWHFCPSHHWIGTCMSLCSLTVCKMGNSFWQHLDKCKISYITLFFYPHQSINPDLFFRGGVFTWVQLLWSIPSASPAARSRLTPSSPQAEAGDKQPSVGEGQWQSEVLWATNPLLGMMSRFWLCSIHWSCCAFSQSQVLSSPAFPKKYSFYLLKQILSLPHLIIQWTLKLCAGWKITCFGKYKISISAAFASPSLLLSPVAPASPTIQTLPVIIFWSKKERQEGEKKFIPSLWDVYCSSCSQPSKVSVILRDIL